MQLAAVTLDDKYTLPSGRIYLSGVQALVRLPMLQHQRDQAAGLNTGGFISGYRGSPLGVYDNALWQARRFLEQHNIQFQPGVNEDLAATAVWGSQQTTLFPGATVDGVFGIWYGKGPGVDRSTDALKHANAAGTAPNGGVLAIAGDDHGCQSSTLAHQSEQIFIAAMMPILNPATVQEYLDYGLLGFALSRYSGCWIGFKAVAEAVESSASISVDPHRLEIVTPRDFEPPAGGLNIRWPDPPLDQERRLHGPKMEAVAAFVRANAIDRIVWDSPAPRLGIISTGKAYLDLRQALDDLGIGEREAARLGLRIYKVGLTWPLEAEGARRFSASATRRRPRPSARPSSARAARTTPRPRCRKGAAPAPASAATPWRSGCPRATPRPGPIWAARAPTGSARRPSPTRSTSSRTWATAPIRIRACWRSARRR